jgi:hypothetical protein
VAVSRMPTHDHTETSTSMVLQLRHLVPGAVCGSRPQRGGLVGHFVSPCLLRNQAGAAARVEGAKKQTQRDLDQNGAAVETSKAGCSVQWQASAWGPCRALCLVDLVSAVSTTSTTGREVIATGKGKEKPRTCNSKISVRAQSVVKQGAPSGKESMNTVASLLHDTS